MIKYDFDEIISRKNTFSTKWDYIEDRFGTPDILPFSISDTDFKTSDEIITAINQRVTQGIFGYTRWNHDEFKDSIVDWYQTRFHASVKPEWIVYSPSVIYSISVMIQLLSDEQDSLVTLSPMYDAFYGVVRENKRRLVTSELVLNMHNHCYELNWQELAELLKPASVKLFLLTNPHNPTGKVFSSEDLLRLTQLCREHDVFLLSDDIHMDIVYPDYHYCPVTEVSQTGISLMTSTSKSFNVPGLMGSYLLIPDEQLREGFLTCLKQRDGLSSVSILGMTATMAGYQHSATYIDQLVSYLAKNRQLIAQFMAAEVPHSPYLSPEGTYLAWMDMKHLNLTSDVIQQALVTIGKVGIMSGKTYGNADFIRLNFACPQLTLEAGLDGLKKALVHLNN